MIKFFASLLYIAILCIIAYIRIIIVQHLLQAKFTCSDEMFFNRHLSNYVTEQNVISKRTMKKCGRRSGKFL